MKQTVNRWYDTEKICIYYMQFMQAVSKLEIICRSNV